MSDAWESFDRAAGALEDAEAENTRLEADLAAAAARAEEAEREVQRLREALEWADAMIWPRIKMLERHNGDKPSEESEALRRILGPIRRAHKAGEAK